MDVANLETGEREVKHDVCVSRRRAASVRATDRDNPDVPRIDDFGNDNGEAERIRALLDLVRGWLRLVA